jgi:hypothetical protein
MLEPINRQLQALVKPQASMASQTEAQAPLAPPVEGIKPFPPYQLPQTPVSYTDYVLDLPDAPLVQPPKPLVSAGPLRLDSEHEASLGSDTAKGHLEDVPLEEKEEMAAVAAPLSFVNYEQLLKVIDKSEGGEGNKKRLPGQYTKAELINMVSSVTGRTFSPSMSWSYDRIKQTAISFVKDIMSSK